MSKNWMVLALLAACGGSTSRPVGPVEVETVEVSAEIRAVVAAADREEADRALDEGRRPAELLAFAGVKRGARVAELFAGGGYTTELLARAVGAEGVVFAHNPPMIYEMVPGKKWVERLGKPVMSTVVKVDRELHEPLPPEATGLDVVLFVLTYHDAAWLGVDRARMNRAVFEALRPGGAFVIVDHSARAGTGIGDGKTLHRIEEQVVRDELAAAGFALAATASFLRNPDDARDWNASPVAAGERRGHSDRFVLKFVRPVR